MEVDLEFVENPRRRKRRRRLTAKQIAAGFGGKSRMSGTRRRRRASSKPRRRYRRRNPSLMSIGNPRRRYRRRSNPSIKNFFGLDLATGAFVGIGIIGVNMVPNLVRRMIYPALPASGIMGYGVKIATVLLLGWGTKLLTKSTQRQEQVMAGGLGTIIVEAYNEFLAPKLGLSGTGGFVSTYNGMSGTDGFVKTGIGQTTYTDTPMMEMAA